MSAASISLGTLLANLAAELDDMARRISQIEDAVSTLGGYSGTGPGQTPSEVLVQLQHLDQMTQALAGLARLVSPVETGTLNRLRVDEASLRTRLAMTSLADRLLGARQPDDDGVVFF